MFPVRAGLLVLVAALLALPAPASAASRLFVLDAGRGSLTPRGDNRFDLELRGTDRRVTWFSERPSRGAGTLPLRELVASWRALGFAQDPPNAVIELDGGRARANQLAVELTRPQFDARRAVLRFRARRLAPSGPVAGHTDGFDRALPRRFGRLSLFVDGADVMGFRRFQVQVQNDSSQTLTGVSGSGSGRGAWDPAPSPSTVIAPGATVRTPWMGSAFDGWASFSGELTLSASGGGVVTISFVWSPDGAMSLSSSAPAGLRAWAWLSSTALPPQPLTVVVRSA